MNLDLVIEQLRRYSPLFEGRVAGAAAYARALSDQVWMKRPAAYVIPLQDEASPNDTQNGLTQVVREKIGVIVDLDNSADRRGQAAATTAVDEARAAVWAALLNWRPAQGIPGPVRQARGFAYDGGGIVPDGLTRAFVRWQFDFVVETTITEADGWQPDALPLEGIDINIQDQDGRTRLEIAVPLPQPQGDAP